MKKILVFNLLFFSQIYLLFAQTTNISGVINTYTAVTNIPVCNPCSSTCNYVDVTSTTGFTVGDKVLVIQMKGATTDLSNTATFGTIQSFGNAGLYEFKTLASVSGTTLTFTSTLYNTYDVPGLVQVVRVPQYVNATVTAKLTAQPWNGATGGILVFDVSGTLTLNADVDVVALGFRGGIGASNGVTYPSDEKNYFYTGTIYELAAPKGEGVAAMLPGYELGKGGYANAGGGGNAHNGGGGGGSNAGAGGLGGNQYNTVTGSVSNGIGGYGILYTAGDRMYMGGGGGAGHQNDHFGTDGGNGGGMVFINAGTVVGNSHKIIASGDSSKSTTGGGNDGAGGAGGGGVIKINATTFSGTISLIAAGGKGGDNTYTAADEHAPGGGGGGGLICLASATTPAGVTTNVLGGAAGLYRINGDNFGTTAGAVGKILNACNFVVPAGPKELKPNLGSDIQLCNPIVANLDARLIGSWYTYTWYKNNVLISGATSQTYSTNEIGRFKVVVSSTGCIPGVDSADITTNAATAINATFCAPPASAVLLKVTGVGKYKWWDAATAGTAVGKGLTYTTPAISTTKTYYVEDTATISGSVGPTVLNTTGLSGYNGSQLGFTLSQDIEITSLRVPFITNYSPAAGYPGFTLTLEVVDQNGNSLVPAQTFTSNASLEPVPGNNGGKTDLYTFPFFNFTIQSSWGSNLRLKFVSATHPNGAASFNQGATFSYPYNSSIPGVVSILGSYTNGGAINTSDYAFFYDWQFKARTNLCLRVPVTATLSCPPPTCAKPTSVTVKLGTGVNDTLCVGSALVIQKNLIDTSTVTSLNGFYFSWRKINASVNTIVQGPSKTYADLSIPSVAVTDSGRYYLIVQDGLVASPACKDSAMVTIRINRAPTAKGLIASNQEICKGSTAAAFTEVKPGVGTVGSPILYKWYTSSDSISAVQTKIAGATSNVYAPAASTPAITTYYVRKDSVAYCAAVKTNFVKVRVNNKPILNKIIPVLRDTLCVGENFNLSTTINLADSTGVNASFNGGYYFTWKKYQAGVLKTTKGPAPYKNYLAANAAVALADSGLYWLIVQDGAGAVKCKDSIQLRIVVNQAPLVKGIIERNQEICKGDAAAIITEKTAPQNFIGNPLHYEWYTTADSTGVPVLSKVLGEITKTYNPGIPLITQYYVRTDSIKYCAAVKTNFVKIRVNNSVVTDTILPLENDTLCVSAGSHFQLKGVVDSTGLASINHGYHFTWMKLQQPATVPVIVGTPGVYSDYPPASRLAAEADSGTYYLIIRDGAGATVCQDTLKTKVVVYLNCTIITPICAKPVFVSTILTGNDTLCVGNSFTIKKDVIDISAGPPLDAYYYSWRKINSAGSVLLAPPSLTYSDLTLTNITQADSGRYYLIVQDGIASGPSCKDSSAAISIVIHAPITTPAVVGSSDRICQGSVPGLLTETTVSSIPDHYQWYISSDSFRTVAASQLIVGAIADSYQSTALSTTSYFIRKDSIDACPAVNSNIITILVDQPIIPGVVGNDTIVCSGSPILAFKEITAASGGTGVFTYQWQASGDNFTFSDIPGETNKTYQSPVLVSNTYFRRMDASTGACNPKPTVAISIIVKSPIAMPAVIAASDTICQGTAPNIFTETNASSVPDFYQWYISTDSFKTVAASQAIPGAVANSYQSAALSNTSYFIRKDSVGYCPAVNSNILTVRVDKPVLPGVVGNDTVVCSGSPILAFKEITAASGGAGIFNYQWQSSSDNTTFIDIPAATNNTYQSPIIISRTYFRRIDSSGVCSSAITDTIFVDAVTGVNPGTIAGASPTICYNTAPTISFTNVTGASNGSGGPGSETYQWQISPDNMYWTDIAGANSLSYTETSPLTDTMYYRRQVGMGPGSCDTSYTASLAIDVYDPFVVGSIPTDMTVCEGTSVTINELTAASGGGDPNTQTYEWIESIDKGVTWITSSGVSNQVNYITPVLTDSIWYRRVVTVTCNKDTSNIMKINVDSINNVSITMSDVSTCVGIDAVFAPTYLGGGITPVFDWYSGSSASGPWTQITAAINPSYTVVNPQAFDNGTFYRVVLTSSFTCNSGSTESVAQLTVNNVVVPVVEIVSNPAGPICDSTTSITYTATAIQGNAGAATYQWYDGITNTPIPSETGTSYTPSTPPANGDQVYVVMTSDVTCANPLTAASNTIMLDVRVKPNPIITNNDTTVCTPGEVFLNASGITSGSNNFQWYKDGVLIPNANQINYTATANDFPGGKYTFVEDNGICNTVSDTVSVTMLQSPSADAGTDITAVEGETISLNGSVSSNTTYYVWIPSAGLSSAYVLQPSLTVPGATTTYSLVAYNNANVCSSSDVVIINVEKRIHIPNVITVNGDGVNDTWDIENIENFPDVEISIFNRWGNLVWKSSGYPKQWDGTNYRNGEVLPDGTYFYIIDLHSVKVKNSYTGWVQIVK